MLVLVLQYHCNCSKPFQNYPRKNKRLLKVFKELRLYLKPSALWVSPEAYLPARTKQEIKKISFQKRYSALSISTC